MKFIDPLLAHQAFWAIGSLFEVLLGFLVMPHLGWRWLLGLSTIPTAIFVIFCFVSMLVINETKPTEVELSALN